MTYRGGVGALYALAQLGGEDGLEERAAQADADDLPGSPEQVRDCAGPV